MPVRSHGGVGRRIAYYRSVARPKMTQQQLADAACVSLGAIRKVERGERGVSEATLEAIADALGIDSMRLLTDRDPAHTRVHDALPVLSAVIATYDFPLTAQSVLSQNCAQPSGKPPAGGWRRSTCASPASCPFSWMNLPAPITGLPPRSEPKWPDFWSGPTVPRMPSPTSSAHGICRRA
ncbi:helix-turn-helix transcriptional regulator [Streptomyces sp. ADMS]|uniref:helix-turn-helix domain-containing protein n=1 Tax=Streptomyces sp. ADMS TaxID=3071415 RepID=UPI00296FE6C2|nr:helix-turn-helix transcriptional regulator [Streptomyces sp. ADMS]MDW4908826.1 helix-turn-helix transcriptional regulator [Streptomyces sp. ADMS]